MPGTYRTIDVWYRFEEVRAAGSVIGAMCANSGTGRKFSSVIHPSRSWPLVERKEWSGCVTRNPDRDAYLDLFLSIAAPSGWNFCSN